MKYLLSIVVIVSTITSVYAMEFHVCTDANGVRHISNQAEFFNPDCSIRDDVYLQVLRMQHAEMQSRHMQADTVMESGDTATNTSSKITGRVTELFDHDKALDELHDRQQQRRGDVPFRSHLQTEGFERLLELQ